MKIPNFVVLFLVESSGNLLDLCLTGGFSCQIVYAKYFPCTSKNMHGRSYVTIYIKQ